MDWVAEALETEVVEVVCIALDLQSGRRRWCCRTVRSDSLDSGSKSRSRYTRCWWYSSSRSRCSCTSCRLKCYRIALHHLDMARTSQD